MNMAMNLSKYLLIGYSVPTDKLGDTQQQALRLLAQTAEEESIDLKQITRLLERARDKLVVAVESNPSTFAETAIASFTYGDLEGKDLESWTATLGRFDILSLWNKDQWISILKTYLVDNPSVSVLGKPSQKLYEAQKIDNKKRTEDYKAKYGELGLKKLQETLDKAQEKNNIPVPESLLGEFKSPNISEIKFIETDMGSSRNSQVPGIDLSSSIQKLVDQDMPDNFNLDIHFEHYTSQFVTVHLLIPTRDIDLELLPLVDVFLTELFSLPLKLDNGDVLDFESAIQKLKTDTLSDDIDYGISGSFDDYLTFQLQVRCDKYDLAVEWLQNALTRTLFTEDRLRIILDKYMNALPERKRSGSSVVRSSMNRTILTNRSLRKATDIFETDEYYKDLLHSLSDSEGVLALQEKLERARESLVTSENIKVLVTGDITKLKNCVKTWAPFAKNLSKNVHPKIPYTRDVRSEQGITVSTAAFVTPMASSESSYAYVVSKGPTDFLHQDIAAISVCCEYLQAVEGPMWRAVRGAGLAYGANIYSSVEEGLIKLHIYRGTNSGEAIKVCQQLVFGFASGETPIEEHLLEGIKNSIIHSAATGGENAGLVASNNYLNCNLKGRERDHLKQHLSRIQKIEASDMQKSFEKYFLDLFKPDSSMVFAACHTSMTDVLKEQLEKTGYTVELGCVIGSEDDDDNSESGSDDSGDDSDGSEE